MKIAIIGAGASGLSCAFQLLKKGVTPVIYEKNSYIGNRMHYSSILPKQVALPYRDSLQSLNKILGAEITPMEKLRSIEVLSPNQKARMNGDLGYIFRRGKEPHSLENQLASKLNVPIVFDSYVKIEDIRDRFDIIVIATGNSLIAKQLDVWTDVFTAHARVATVLGEFSTSSMKVWTRIPYARNVICYLVPNNPREASLIMIANGITHHELYYYWDNFITQEGISYIITEVRDTEESCGFVSLNKIEKFCFIGNAGGITTDFIGLGTYNAVVSGVHTANTIVEKNCMDIYQPIYKKIVKINEFRKSMSLFGNDEFDTLPSLLGPKYQHL